MAVKTITITHPLTSDNPNPLAAGKYMVTGTSSASLPVGTLVTVWLLQQGQNDQSFSGPSASPTFQGIIKADHSWAQEITAVANPDPAATYTIQAIAQGGSPSDSKTGIRFQ